MQKDVIYIDVEDDITAIIGKVKASKEKVIALVPPKRVGVLQSAVNLRLLNRAAKQSDKHLALVTNNQSLIALASAASIPVAKNLQSKPELADIPALEVDDGEDIIDGGALPVGEHAKQSETASESGRDAAMAATLAEAPKDGELPKKPKAKSGPKVPNFNKFRKRLVLIIGGSILLIGFMVWAIFFAPRATVVISAKTSSNSVNEAVRLTSTGKTSLEDGTIKAAAQSQTESKTVEFQATGKKDAGKKATGTVEFSTDDAGTAIQGVTIPAGTKLRDSNGNIFTTDSTVNLNTSNYTGAPTGITAAENGSKYNAASGSMSGAPEKVSAVIQGSTSGGVTKMVTVVTAADVQTAKEELAADDDTDSIKSALKAKFGDDAIVVEESFDIGYSDVSSNPDVGDEADNATLSAKVTYRLYGVEKAELSRYLDAYMKKELKDKDDQRVYDNGSDKANFQETSKVKNGARTTLIATAQVGPKIDDQQVKDQVKGKRFGEIQKDLESVQGVSSVDVKFFPFWVNTVPGEDARITIEFKLDESK